ADATRARRATRWPSRACCQRWRRQSYREAATRPPRRRARTRAEPGSHPSSLVGRDQSNPLRLRDRKASRGKSNEWDPARPIGRSQTALEPVDQSRLEAPNRRKALPSQTIFQTLTRAALSSFEETLGPKQRE